MIPDDAAGISLPQSADAARVTVWLWIEALDQTSGDLDRAIGVKCNKSHTRGGARGITGKVWAHHGWMVERECVSPDDAISVGEAVRKCLRSVLDYVAPAADRFRLQSAGCERGLMIGVRAGAAPALRLENTDLDVIARLGVPLEIDLVLP